ncbi:MAG: hypothetical protein M1824_004401 [Vezdaea acicularis]|nr:MAG: hypothetical protein M1824_004401 [Vezdaea acicularis]
MSSHKVVVVFGATGKQGGSVIKALLSDPQTAKEFKIRGITRDPSKPAAQALTKQGVECVAGDLNSKESLDKAIKGAYGVYAVTNYWEKMDGKVEEEQGRTIADICKKEGVQHLIWSSLYNVTELTGGKYQKVYHFDSKAHVEEYIRSIGVPATFFMPGFYMSNFSGGMMKEIPSGEMAIFQPVPSRTPYPLFDADEDTGKYVKAILKHRDQTLGKRVFGATAYYNLSELADTFTKVTGKKAVHLEVTGEQFMEPMIKMGMPQFAAEELLQNMQFMTDYGYYGKESLDWSNSLLDEKPTTWAEFIKTVPAWKDLK